MKLIFSLFVIISCISCKGQENNSETKENNKETTVISQIKNIDTLSVIKLNAKKYADAQYQVLKLYNIDNDVTSIEIVKNKDLLNTIKLPGSEDMKNFSVNKIVEINKGFQILVSWGGGNYFYKRKFNFVYNENGFYFSSLVKGNYTKNSDKEIIISEQIYPPIPLRNFDISLYLENE